MGGANSYYERIVSYHRLPSQYRFLESTARFKGFSGPIGSGKSFALVWQAIHSAYGNPGRTGLIGAPTYPMLRDATLAALIETLDSNGIPYDLNRSENYLILSEARARVLLRAIEDFDRLRGSNLSWFGVDELTYAPEEAWLRLEGRLRDPEATNLCGFAVWTPKGFDWVYERFIANPIDGYETVRGEPFENRYLLAKVPDYYERLRRSYDLSFYEQEVLGNYLSLASGRVYSQFDRSGNVSPIVMAADRPLLWALDFNVDPMCSIVAQVTEDGVVQVLDEIVLSRATTQQACIEFVARYEEFRAGLTIYADATGARMQTTGKSDLEILKGFFREANRGSVRFSVPSSNPVVRDRITLVNAKLRSADGHRSLFVHPRCGELIKDLEQVVYKANSQVIDKEIDPKRTHLSDALGYLLWQECRTTGYVGERGQRLF